MWNWIWFDSQIFFSLLLGISNCYKFIFIYSLKVSRQLLFFSLPASFSSLSLMGDMEIICQMKKKRWKCERNERRKILTSRNPPSPHSHSAEYQKWSANARARHRLLLLIWWSESNLFYLESTKHKFHSHHPTNGPCKALQTSRKIFSLTQCVVCAKLHSCVAKYNFIDWILRLS